MLEFDFAAEVELLSRLTGRDLSNWLPTAGRDPRSRAGVSCVIPYFNSSSTIERALRSVSSQTEPVKEVIIIDDGSDSKQRQLLESVAKEHPNVTVIRLESNLGAGAARNRGWDQSSGEWVAFLDADDSWHHQKVEIQLKALAAHPEVSIMGHPVEVHEESDAHPEASFQDLTETVRPVTATQFMIRNRWPTPSVMVRASIPLRFEQSLRRSEGLRAVGPDPK